MSKPFKIIQRPTIVFLPHAIEFSGVSALACLSLLAKFNTDGIVPDSESFILPPEARDADSRVVNVLMTQYSVAATGWKALVSCQPELSPILPLYVIPMATAMRGRIIDPTREQFEAFCASASTSEELQSLALDIAKFFLDKAKTDG